MGGWRDIAAEMLKGRELGAQCSREEAWRRACTEVAKLRAEIETLKEEVKSQQDQQFSRYDSP